MNSRPSYPEIGSHSLGELHRNVEINFHYLVCVTAELKMDVLREREVKDSLERQLQDEQKVRGEYKSTRVYLVLRSREGVCPSTKHRIENGRLTQVLQVAPNPLRRKLTWPTSNALKGNAENARSATHGNLTGVHRAPRAGFRSRSLVRR